MRRRLRDSNSTRPSIDWQERAQFFALAATAMRHFRVARARERRARRAGSPTTIVMENMDPLDGLLSRLASLDARQARIVEMRYFGGLSIEQTALALGLSGDTVRREWTHARAWLRLELSQRSF